jgi:hypothetical protein
MINPLALNTTNFTNAENHRIKRHDIIGFLRTIIFVLPPFTDRLTPEGTLNISRLYKNLRNMTSINELEYIICSFFTTKNYPELFSFIYRISIPMGAPIEVNGKKSYGIVKEYIAGFRTPCNILSGKKMLNKNKRYLFINGMGTDINVHKNYLDFLEKTFNVTVDGIYNPTHSILLDTVTLFTQYLSATADTILFDCVMNYIFSVVDEDEIVIIAHSKGTVTIGYVVYFIIYNIIVTGFLKSATTEQHLIAVRGINIIKKMRVYTIANCAISNDFLKIGDKYYPEFYSFCNIGDPVPWFGRLGDAYLQYYTDMDRIENLTANNVNNISYDDISNVVDPQCIRKNTSYIDKLFTLDKPGHPLETYIFKKEGFQPDYVYEIVSKRELHQ